MKTARRLLPLAAGLFLSIPAAGQEGTVVIKASGDNYGFQDESRSGHIVSVFLGGVEVTQGDRRLLGRSLVLVLRREGPAAEPPPGLERGLALDSARVVEMYLEGDVSLEQGDERVFGASSALLDNTNGTVTIMDGEWRASFQGGSLVARYDVMRHLADGQREFKGASLTTCDYAHAHWSMDTPWARLAPTPEGRLLDTGGNSVWVGGVPVLWLPGVHLNVDRDRPPIRGFGIGTSGRFGTEINTLWGGEAEGLPRMFGADEVKRAEWELTLNNYSRRGVFIEPRFDYETGSSKGEIFGSYIHDRASTDELDIPFTDDTRGRVDIQHRTRLDEQRTVDLELSYLSDSGYLREYYDQESRVGKEQETYLNYRDVEENEAFQALLKIRLNDFQEQLESLPGLEHRLAGAAVDTGPLGTAYFSSLSYVDNVRLDAPETTPTTGSLTPPVDDSTRAVRGGTAGQLTWPVDLGGDRLRVTAGYDLAAFDRHASTPDDLGTPLTNELVVEGGSTGRYALTGGVEWSRTYSGTSDLQSETWNLDGIRQIVEPRVGYSGVFGLNKEPSELVTFDDKESLDKLQTYFVGLRHRIQTHQGDGVATLVDNDVLLPIFPNEDRDNDNHTLGPITVDSTVKPGANIWGLRNATLRWRGLIDPNAWAYRRSFISYSSSFGPDRRILIAHDSIRHVSKFLTFGTEWILTPKWSAAVFVQQDLLLHENSRRGLLLRELAHRWIVDFEVSWRRGSSVVNTNDSEDDTQVSVSFRPLFLDRGESILDTLGRVHSR